MSNKGDKKKDEELRRRQEEEARLRNMYMSRAAQEDPLEALQRKETTDWINQTTAKGWDVTKASGMQPYMSLFNNASQRQQGERMGIGALRMGAGGQNANLTARLREQSDAERQQAAAGQLENAFRMKDASVRGNIMPLMGFAQNRQMGLASLASGNANNSLGAWSSFRPRNSFWQDLLLTGMQGANNAARAAAAGG